MPPWIVHEVLGELCDIPRELMREINNFIDSIKDPEAHDLNRVILHKRWHPEALFHLTVIILDRYGFKGLRATLHHHLLDYAEGIGRRHRVHKTFMGYYLYPEIAGAVRGVMDNAVKDFEVLDKVKLVRDLEERWGVTIKYPEDVLKIIKDRGYVKELKDSLIKAVDSLRTCIMECVYELIVYYLSFPKDSCVICKCLCHSNEKYRISELGYRIHEECLNRLKSRASELLKGMSREDAYKRLAKDATPYTIAYQIVFKGDIIGITGDEEARFWKIFSSLLESHRIDSTKYRQEFEETLLRHAKDSFESKQRAIEELARRIINKAKRPRQRTAVAETSTGSMMEPRVVLRTDPAGHKYWGPDDTTLYVLTHAVWIPSWIPPASEWFKWCPRCRQEEGLLFSNLRSYEYIDLIFDLAIENGKYDPLLININWLKKLRRMLKEAEERSYL